MTKTTPQVDGFIRKNHAWQAELSALRALLLATPLTEEVKWRVPCYTLKGKNVAFIGPLKSSCVLSFVKGALLKDPRKILVQQTENSQSVRVVRFSNLQEIKAQEKVLMLYIAEAIANESAGLKVPLKKITDHKIPAELQLQLDASPALKTAFSALTPGRQRGYILHISRAKQSSTRTTRVQKAIPTILAGKGLEDE